MSKVEKTIPVRTLYGVWDEGGTFYPKNVVAELSVALAKKLLGEGKVERADPLPGDD